MAVESKFLVGKFVKYARRQGLYSLDYEVVGFKATDDNVLYDIKDGGWRDEITQGAPQSALTGLNMHRAVWAMG